MDDLYSMFGHRQQSAIHDSKNLANIMSMPFLFKPGVIAKVFTADDPKNFPGITSGAQGYITYNVELTPEGIIIENLPAMGQTTGHLDGMTVDPNYPLDTPSMDMQNTYEEPYVVGQPVVVGFLNNSPLNGFIIGSLPSQFNNGTQTSAQYPEKRGSWQGTSWKIDKNGNPVLTLPTADNLTVVVGSTVLLTISNGVVQIGNGSDVGVLGNALVAYLNAHTHTGGTILGLTGPPVVPATGITTSVLKVQ